MAWLSRNDWQTSDKLHADDLNNLANDQRTWGGDVNGGNHVLSNVVLASSVLRDSSAVVSVFGRVGAVTAVNTDYTPAFIGAAPASLQLIAGPGLGGGGSLTGNVTFTADVKTVFGRIGTVTLTSAEITGALGVLQTRSITAGSGLQGGGDLSMNRSFAVVPDSTKQQIQVLVGGTAIGQRSTVNFVQNGAVTLSAVDDQTNNRVNLTVSATGGAGGGMIDPTTTLGDLIVRGSSVVGRLALGSNGQVLTVDTTQPLSLRWNTPLIPAVTTVFNRIGAIVATVGDYNASQVTNAVDATVLYTNPPWIVNIPWTKVTNAPNFMVDALMLKGDMAVSSGSGTTRLPVGADGTVLLADSAQTLGVRWGLPTLVSTVFNRSGTVVAKAGDYTVAQITDAVGTSRRIDTDATMQGGGPLLGDLVLSVKPNTTNQQVQILDGGTLVGTRHGINFVTGQYMSLTIADDKTNDCVNISIASTGGGGGMVDPTIYAGDIIVRGPSAVQRLPLGFNGQVLTVDTTLPNGVKWATGSGGGAQSPWTTDIDAAGHILGNTPGIGINKAALAATARLDVLATGTEDGVRVVNSTGSARASIRLTNNGSASLILASYGSSYTTDPGLLGIEASTALKFMVTGAEAMRLSVASRLLIGTKVDNGNDLLQVNGSIKSLAGGYVFPDGTTQTTAATGAVASVFGRTGVVAAQIGDYSAAQITNGVSTLGSYADPAWITSLAWSKITGAPASGVTSVFGRTGVVAAQSGDYTAAQVTNAVSTLGSYADPVWLTALNWGKITGAPTAGSFQTPWVSNINAANYQLQSAGNIGVGTAVPSYPLDVINSVVVLNGATTQIRLAGVANSGYISIGEGIDGKSGVINFFSNNTLAQGVAVGNGVPGGAQSGDLVTSTWTTSGWVERIRVTNAGLVGIGKTPTSTLDVANIAASNGVAIYATNGVATGTQYAMAAVTSGAATANYGLYVSASGATSNYAIQIAGPAAAANNWAIHSDAPAQSYFAGSVGIGVQVPGCALQVNGQVGIGGVPSASRSFGLVGGASLVGFSLTTNGVNWYVDHRGNADATTNRLMISSDGGAVFTILNNGPVGIGTNSPAYNLDVRGTLYASSNIGSAGIFYSSAAGSTFGGPTGNYTTPTTANTNILLYNNSAVNWAGIGADGAGNMYFRVGTSGSPLPAILIQASNSFTGFGTGAPAQQVTIIPASNPSAQSNSTQFAIGESSNNPSYRLQLGFYNDAGGWKGFVQAQQGGPAGGVLMLNPSGGNVGIGNGGVTPGGKLHILSGSNATGAPTYPGTVIIDEYNASLAANAGIEFRTRGDGGGFGYRISSLANNADLVFEARAGSAAWTERMRLVNGGYLGLGGIVSPSWMIHLGLDSAAKPTTTTWVNTSDSRVKRNIRDLEGGLEVIEKLRPVEAEYNGAHGLPEGQRLVSFLAEEIREILPGTVSSHRGKLRADDAEETDILDFNMHEVLFHLVLAVKQLAAMQKAQKN